MSVLSAKRSLSKAEFVNKSLELVKLTLHLTKKFPKSITFHIINSFVSNAREVYENVYTANEIYIDKNHPEAVNRRKVYLEAALNKLASFEADSILLFDCYYSCLTENQWSYVGGLITEIRKLIKSVIESDSKRA